GAINLAAHVSTASGGLDAALLRGTVATAVRMLDNAVELNSYPTGLSRLNGVEYRTIGLGMIGLDEALARLRIQNGSTAAHDFTEWCAELISHSATMASAELARERGSFPGYAESKWSYGILPIDALGQLARERGVFMDTQGNT